MLFTFEEKKACILSYSFGSAKLLITRAATSRLFYQLVALSIKCQKTVKIISICVDVLKRLVLSTTQRLSVYCRGGGKKPENMHM